MARILNGAEVAKSINADCVSCVNRLKEQNIVPTLHLVRFGERDDDLFYEKSITGRAAGMRIEVKRTVMEEEDSFDRIAECIRNLNGDEGTDGILVFFPLPAGLSSYANTVRDLISPEKDVDCLSGISNGKLYMGEQGFAPCTAEACIRVLDHYGIDCRGKNAVVVGRSLVLGKPLSMMLLQRDATVTICHSKTENLAAVTRNADIVVTAVGRLKAFGTDYFREGQTVIDVGTNWDPEKNGFSGDVDFEAVSKIVEAITPVPGGVGRVTTSVLLSHVVQAAEKRMER